MLLNKFLKRILRDNRCKVTTCFVFESLGIINLEHNDCSFNYMEAYFFVTIWPPSAGNCVYDLVSKKGFYRGGEGG